MNYNHPVPDELSRFPGIGGGANYDPGAYSKSGWPTGGPVTRDDATHVVTTASGFKRAVMTASDGAVVWVPGGANIDVTGLENVVVDSQITIASNRGTGGSGALLHTSKSPIPFMNILASNARVTGLRFLAPITNYQEYKWSKEGVCITINADAVEIDNCVFRGFGYAGVEVGRRDLVTDVHVHHNRFVDNLLAELGYGVIVRSTRVLILGNYFDNNRHAVTSDGDKHSRYIARYNFCGPHTILQTFDMHAADEVNSNAGDYGGCWFWIVNNVVMADTEHNGHKATGIFIRGNPLERSVIAHNQFAHQWTSDDNPGWGVNEWGDAYVLNVRSVTDSNITVGHNYYGVDSPNPVPDF